MELIHPTDPVARRTVVIPAAVGTSLTNRPMAVVRPGHRLRLLDVGIYAEAVAGTVSIQGYLMNQTELVSGAALAIHSTPTQFAVGAFRARVGGIFVEKAAATGITFSAAHTVTADLHGCITVQMNNAGTISTKVPAATQGYASAQLALDAKVAADSDKVEIGHILIANNAGDWVANTDNMTNGGNVTTATFTSRAVTVVAAFSAALVPLALQRVVATLATARAAVIAQNTRDIVLLYTTDGSGSITRGSVDITYRPFPLRGEVATQTT